MRQVLSIIEMRIETMLRAEEGQGLTEYALILGLVAVIAIVALELLGTNISSLLNSVANKV